MVKRRGGRKTVSYAGSIVEPTNAYARKMWLKQQKHQQKSTNWIIPLTAGLILLLIIIAVVITLSAKEQPAEVPAGEIPEPTISDEEDLGAYFSELVSDPDYKPEFSDSYSRYLVPPTNISCADFKKVSKMNADILNLYLDSGYIVSISEGGSTILVYHGVYDDYLYRTIPISCPSPIDTTIEFTAYNSSELFSNISSDAEFYVWVDSKTLNQDGGAY